MPTHPNQLTDVVELKALPIFSAGVYPQGAFDADFLQTLADNYDPAFHEAPNYLAHAEDGGDPRPAGPLAFGWIKKLYLKGETLLADLADVPRAFADLVLAGRVKKRSVELYPDLPGKGPYLRALAWPMIPQVKGLADVHPTQIFRVQHDPYLSIPFHEKEPSMTPPESNFVSRDELQSLLAQLKSDLSSELKSLQAAAEVRAFCDQMVLAGKMLPAERATEELMLAAQAQKDAVRTFAETETPLSVQRMDYFRNRKPLLGPGLDPVPEGPDPKNQKTVRYFHEHQDFFTRLGVSLDDLLAAEQPANPLTA